MVLKFRNHICYIFLKKMKELDFRMTCIFCIFFFILHISLFAGMQEFPVLSFIHHYSYFSLRYQYLLLSFLCCLSDDVFSFVVGRCCLCYSSCCRRLDAIKPIIIDRVAIAVLGCYNCYNCYFCNNCQCSYSFYCCYSCYHH